MYSFKFVCTLVALLCFFSLFGQATDNQSRIDSLQSLLEENTALNYEKVDALNQLGYEYWIIDPVQSESYGIEALEIAKILPYAEGYAFANRVIGVAHWARGNLELSFKFLLAAEEAYAAIPDSLGLANSMLNLGMAYADQGNTALAQLRYEKVLALFIRLGQESRVATTYTKIADLLIAQGNYDPAFTYLRQALDIHKDNDFLYGIAEVNSKLGKLATAQHNYNDAISYFLLAVEAGGRRNDRVGLAAYFHGIGNAYLQRGNYNRAAEYLQKAKMISEDFGLQSTKRDVYFAYKELEKKRGNYAASISYFEQYVAIKDSLFNKEKSNIIANLEAQRTFDEKEKALDLAQKNLDILKQENKANNLLKLVLLLGLAMVIALIWGMLQRKERLLVKKRKDLAQAHTVTGKLEDTIRGKEQELTSYTLNFVHKNKLFVELKENVESLKPAIAREHRSKLEALTRKIDSVLSIDEDWADFRKHFESVHPSLMARLNEDFPTLTKSEYRLIALIRLNLSSKEISSVLGISPDSVKTARYRLRKKLSLVKQQGLFDFLLRYS